MTALGTFKSGPGYAIGEGALKLVRVVNGHVQTVASRALPLDPPVALPSAAPHPLS